MNKIRYLLIAILISLIARPGYCEEKGMASGNQVNELIKTLKEKGILTDLSKGVSVLSPSKGLTLQLGLRVQPRYIYDEETNNNDMMIRRTRLKAKGDAYEKVKYYLEWKIDNVGQEGKTATAKVEGAFIEYLYNPFLNIRAGIYDAPFSRDALTSDAKLLLMDRSLIYEELLRHGLADNTYGLLLYGRPYDGFIEYSFGLFDSDVYDNNTNELMWGGRFVINLFDRPKVGYADYMGSYIGEGKRLSIGANYERLANITVSGNEFDLSAWGMDIFGNYGRFTLQSEYDRFEKDFVTQGDVKGYGWYVQGGYLLPLEYRGTRFEIALRYQLLEPDTRTSGDKKRWTALGLNSYLNGHNLKLQMDYTFKDEEGQGVDNNTFMLQGQIEF